ncbi:hypothetical protein QJS10_CPA07g00429 [Acorus calamus]|uniref:DUF4283 domain-containing protein n=1 Tax=Acorus calamus TaxID=4465 RepID=A0AAV9EFX3_ACOCL|nr:hypothetical protein QJS10_CPA07g00429 [Acorus calamus]
MTVEASSGASPDGVTLHPPLTSTSVLAVLGPRSSSPSILGAHPTPSSHIAATIPAVRPSSGKSSIPSSVPSLPTSSSHREGKEPMVSAFPPLPSKMVSQPKKPKDVSAPPLINQTPLCWDQLFSGSSAKPHKFCTLEFSPPSLEDETKVVEIVDEDCELANEFWANSIVGYIIGINPVYTPFLQFLTRLWKPKGDFKLFLKGNGFFLVKFSLQEDMMAVLEGGPWTMSNRPFILRQWSSTVKMEHQRLSSIPIWVKFPTLPLHLWTPSAIGKVTSAIGTPLFMDTGTRMRTRISNARICVEVEAGEVLPDLICVRHNGDLEHYPVIYEWRPVACPHCVTFGHDEAMCGNKKSSPSDPQQSIPLASPCNPTANPPTLQPTSSPQSPPPSAPSNPSSNTPSPQPPISSSEVVPPSVPNTHSSSLESLPPIPSKPSSSPFESLELVSSPYSAGSLEVVLLSPTSTHPTSSPIQITNKSKQKKKKSKKSKKEKQQATMDDPPTKYVVERISSLRKKGTPEASA